MRARVICGSPYPHAPRWCVLSTNHVEHTGIPSPHRNGRLRWPWGNAFDQEMVQARTREWVRRTYG